MIRLDLWLNGRNSALALLCSFSLVLAPTGCAEASAKNEVRDQANAQCAKIVAEMRAHLQPLYQRAEGLAADDERLLRLVKYTTTTQPFRNPSPCFGHPSLASDVPQGFSLELDASLSSLRANFDNAGRRREYEALEDAHVRSEVLKKIASVRALARLVAASD